jgi:hypothetical protein
MPDLRPLPDKKKPKPLHFRKHENPPASRLRQAPLAAVNLTLAHSVLSSRRAIGGAFFEV